MSVQRQEMEVSGAAPVETSTSHPAQGELVVEGDPNKPFRNRSQRARWDYGGNPVSACAGESAQIRSEATAQSWGQGSDCRYL